MEKIKYPIIEHTIRSWYMQNPYKGLDKTYDTYFIALKIISYYMGDEWVEKHINPFKNPENYFKLKSDIQPEKVPIHAYRIIKMGEFFLNMYGVPNFFEQISLMDSGGQQIESTIAVLDVAKLFIVNNIPFRFVKPQNIKSSDYDMEFKIETGVKINCEVKCKLESTEISENTFKKALSTAVSQLPKNEPGVVAVKVPESWFNQNNFAKTIEQAVKSFFSYGGERLVAIIAFVEPTKVLTNGVIAPVLSWQFINEKSKFAGLITDDIIPDANEIGIDWTKWRQIDHYLLGIEA